MPATSRHTNPLLPLLPSGPGGVYSVSLREDQHSNHNVFQSMTERGGIMLELEKIGNLHFNFVDLISLFIRISQANLNHKSNISQ